MEVLKFIFSGFWVWMGVTILALGILGTVADVIKSFRKPERELQVTKYNDRTIIAHVKNPEKDDYERVIEALGNEKEWDVLLPKEGEEE